MTSFADICNNEHVKRAIEVAITGSHKIAIVCGDLDEGMILAHVYAAIRDEAQESLRIQQGKSRFTSYSPYILMPCPCGCYGHAWRRCTCSMEMVDDMQRTWPRDAVIWIEMREPDPHQVYQWIRNGAGTQYAAEWESTEQVVTRITAAVIRDNLPVSQAAWDLLNAFVTACKPRPLALKDTVAVAQTVAKLQQKSTAVAAAHMAEAIQYRGDRT